MKSVILLSLCALIVIVTADSTRIDINKAEELFEQFIKDYNRVYKDEADRKVHFEAFKKNLVKINESNAREPNATFGINQFADFTDEEWEKMNGLKPPKNKVV